MSIFYSNGKLLLTGEYVVLNGALSIALPTRLGQSLEVKPIKEKKLVWRSITHDGQDWFKTVYNYSEFESGNLKSDHMVAKRLFQILMVAKQLNKEFLNTDTGFEVYTRLDFPITWGLGSSSTLINNVASWAKVDAYKLLQQTFGGSGYDIACAKNNFPISYQQKSGKRLINKVPFNPKFKDFLYFVHLNNKQNSRTEVKEYRLKISKKRNLSVAISAIDQISKSILNCQHIKEFEKLINEHERIIAELIEYEPVKFRLFKDYPGSIKSLGAWGGDFALATGDTDCITYFKNKNFTSVFPYSEIIL